MDTNLDLKEFDIKIATKEDSSNVINMLKQIAQWMKDHEINQWRFLLEGGDDEEIEQAIANQETYIVSKGNELVATFTLLSKQSEWDSHIWGEDQSSKSLYLHRLAVVPTLMNNNLGSSLLSWIENHAVDREYLRLDCVADNVKLNNFYKNHEFELVGITDGHSKYEKRLKS
ncbi:GNAT family N-acetyltransferase [Ureibacillus manganicus]|uniref:GNAT family N-acetyltransferase n=1 Tax=Ureibacillus manganicus TaxID=1266064 RepID=UPI000B02C0BC